MKGRRLHLRCRISFRKWDNKSKSDIVSDIRCRDRHQQRQHKYISFSFGFILVAACLHKAHLSVGRRHPRVYRWRCTAHNANHPNEQHSKRDDSINLYDFRWHLAQRAKPILMVPSNVCVCVCLWVAHVNRVQVGGWRYGRILHRHSRDRENCGV